MILDNLSAHKTPVVHDDFLAENPTVRLHFTPTYSSWLNQVEIWFAKIERGVIARGIFTSVPDLARKLRRYINAYSANARPIRWKYSDPTRRIRGNDLSATGQVYRPLSLNRTMLLLVGFSIRWAVTLASIPTRATRTTELHRVDLATHIVLFVIADGEFHLSHCSYDINISRLNRVRRLPASSFLCGPITDFGEELRWDGYLADDAKVLEIASRYGLHVFSDWIDYGAWIERDKNHEELKASIRALTADKSYSQCTLANNSSNADQVMPSEVRPIRSERLGEVDGKLEKMPARCGIPLDDAVIRCTGYVRVFPRGDRNRKAIASASGSGGDKDHLPIKCKDLAFIIRLNRSAGNSAVSRNDYFPIREVHYANRSVVDLGKCRKDRGSQQGHQPFRPVFVDAQTPSPTGGDA